MTIATLARLAAAAALGTVALAAPASAAKKTVITMPASAIPTPDARVCMPRKLSTVARDDKTLPDTLCQTVAAWGEHGVTIVGK